ncbi:GTPase-associated protein 1-related protein [Streptomyces sp. NPDC087300]|uniref:GTPase-associated protein 1-related protein n=1 Tax=Streptomyces sp. NPDC087300 TaxID=3365780 RepID=UPI0038287FD8
MAIRRLSYRLGQEPDTGAVRLIPAPGGQGQRATEITESERSTRTARETRLTDPSESDVAAAVERVIGVGVWAGGGAGAGAGAESDPGADAQVRAGADPGADAHAGAGADPGAADAHAGGGADAGVGAGADPGADAQARAGADPGADALAYSLLPDGGRLLCAALPGRSVEVLYLGADTPGPGALWPIDTWRAECWEAGAADVLGAGFVESELPAGEPALAGGHFDHELLVEFARARSGRVAPFLADVRRLFGDPAGRQIVLVEQDPAAVARWVALACASLPEAYVPALTFTTWTTDPRRAPQQIIGIGPDAAFDRSDEATLAYLYRVHDATGGPESPPAETDAWAELTAERWLAGNPPRPAQGAGHGVGEPFALLPLISAPAASGAASGADLAGLSGGSLHAVVDSFAGAVRRGEADERTLGELDRLCRGLDGEHAVAARPLALALVRHRLDTAGRDALPDLTAFEGLPLGQDAWRELRETYGGRADDTLRRRLRGPMASWTEPLRLALALGADGGPGLAEAMERIATALLRPGRRECAHAVRLLEDIDRASFTRRILRLLIHDFTEHKLDLLRDLARSAQGDWLRRNIEDAPLTIKLAAAAAYWSGPPDHLQGAELFDRLTELLSTGRVEDVRTLRLLWRMVWRNKGPVRAEQSWVARTCTPRLLVEADLGRRVVDWMKDPDRCDRDLVEFARAMRKDTQIGVVDRYSAELLVLAQDLADGRVVVDKDAVDRLRELGRKVTPLGRVLRQGVDERVASALAKANPLDLCEAHALHIFVAAGPELLRAYRAHMLDEAICDRLVRELPHKPSELAGYYHIWRPRTRHNDHAVSEEWREISAELLDRALGPVLAHLDHQRLGQVATVLQREGQDVQEWTAWRHRVAQRPQ